ncbi:hypothetical protein ACJJIK_06205 [Microbulbifer sp. ZKSA006]|uniref:hypothetical protein n=1 Tax=Microbulbifer sp. ZKSA006 TaxID=3243390 RepID=UPI00403A31D6
MQKYCEYSGNEGIELNGIANILIGNTIIHSNDVGTEMDGNFSIFISKTPQGNDNSSIEIGGNFNIILNNTATESGPSAIYLSGSGSTNNNIASRNQIFDLFKSEDCSINSNFCSGNAFENAAPSCQE